MTLQKIAAYLHMQAAIFYCFFRKFPILIITYVCK